MYDCKNSCGQEYWCIEEITPHIEIYSTLHRKAMILTTVVFSDCDELKKLSHTLRFIAHQLSNEFFWRQVCSAIGLIWRNDGTYWNSWQITYEINDCNYSCRQLFWWFEEIIAHVEIHSTLEKNRIIVSRVLSKYSDKFNQSSHTLWFIVHWIRNVGFEK